MRSVTPTASSTACAASISRRRSYVSAAAPATRESANAGANCTRPIRPSWSAEFDRAKTCHATVERNIVIAAPLVLLGLVFTSLALNYAEPQSLRPLAESRADLAIASFARRRGGGFGVAKGTARALIALRTGRRADEPLSGQRRLSEGARTRVFPLAAGFGVETGMTIDAVRAGLDVEEVELDLAHRATGRDVRGFFHRGTQLRDVLLSTVVPQGRSFRGLRLPVVGPAVVLGAPVVAPVVALGLADDLWSGPERGLRAHLRAGATTGTLKLLGIPLWALWRTRSPSGAVLVALCANVLNQLDTRPGRALKAFLAGSLVLGGKPRGAVAVAVLLAPYDHREMVMLGDAGSNALGAVLGLGSVRRLTGPRRIAAIGALAALTVLADRRSLGTLIESTPGLRELDALGRQP